MKMNWGSKIWSRDPIPQISRLCLRPPTFSPSTLNLHAYIFGSSNFINSIKPIKFKHFRPIRWCLESFRSRRMWNKCLCSAAWIVPSSIRRCSKHRPQSHIALPRNPSQLIYVLSTRQLLLDWFEMEVPNHETQENSQLKLRKTPPKASSSAQSER